jgi:hypothetical protein
MMNFILFLRALDGGFHQSFILVLSYPSTLGCVIYNPARTCLAPDRDDQDQGRSYFLSLGTLCRIQVLECDMFDRTLMGIRHLPNIL